MARTIDTGAISNKHSGHDQLVKPDLDNAFERVNCCPATRDQYCHSCGETIPQGEMRVSHYDKQHNWLTIWHRYCFAKRRF